MSAAAMVIYFKFLFLFVCLFVLSIYLSSAAKLLGGDLEDGVRIN